ncbi:type VII secretion protein EccB [Kitasatospora aureofaciens]|uniref:type VII secretion protein EccB n=1 Tax=Kitasatospora aureofaciens TaxID=1894 RepID=UPI001C479576|nr:type VII secretion protein EccB [Kitasatospora aureofaciens]MBV6699322.1 type VII secretion protein EccB [Kitasatospora aureofaciens]
MQSKRDQVQAHLFVMGRLATGMLRGEPDAPDTPTGRTSRGTVTGVIIAVLACLIAAVYGVLVPGGATGWKKPGTLVLVKENGARYLYLDGTLHPLLNEATARLLAGDQLTVDQVSQRSLADTPRGAPLGILGAPDGLPEPDRLTTAPWLACATLRPGPSGARQPQLALTIDPATHGTALTDNQGILVTAPDGTGYLLWHGRRLRLDTPNRARQALGQAAATAQPVTQAFLNALPAGPDLAAPDVDQRGTPGPDLATRPTRIGQLFTGPSGDPYLLTRAGLTPLTTMALELLRNDPRTQQIAYQGAAVTPAGLGAADLAAHSAPPAPAATAGALPTAPPELLTAPQGRDVCADLRPGDPAPTTSVTLLDDTAVQGPAPSAQPGVEAACATAESIAVRPGGGALVRALSTAGAGTTLYLVTDAGVKYPLASPAVAKQLGYGAVAPAGVPEPLLTLLPTGPSLDPAALTGAATSAPNPPGPACPR